nr:hypothetical protein [Tanacetum cinerariifolium]
MLEVSGIANLTLQGSMGGSSSPLSLQLVGLRCGKSPGCDLRALVRVGDQTSGDASPGYMISGDAKSWVIKPPMMMTQSAGQPAAASRGWGTGGRAGSGGSRTRGHSGGQGNGMDDVPGGHVGGQDSGQGRGQGNCRNQTDDAVNDNIRDDVNRGYTYKEFLACNPKEYDGKGGAIVYTCWIMKMESVHDMSGCKDSQRVKYIVGSFVDFRLLTRAEFCPSNEMQKLETKLWNHAMVGASHVAYTDRFHELARMVATIEPKTIQKAMQIAGTFTDETLRNGTIKKNHEKKGNVGEPSKDSNGKEDNKRTRTGNAFSTTTVTPPKMCVAAEDCTGALLHNITATVT